MWFRLPKPVSASCWWLRVCSCSSAGQTSRGNFGTHPPPWAPSPAGSWLTPGMPPGLPAGKWTSSHSCSTAPHPVTYELTQAPYLVPADLCPPVPSAPGPRVLLWLPADSAPPWPALPPAVSWASQPAPFVQTRGPRHQSSPSSRAGSSPCTRWPGLGPGPCLPPSHPEGSGADPVRGCALSPRSRRKGGRRKRRPPGKSKNKR